ncbi:MAG: hypothetical protein HC945_03340 [Nitrosarchaeum sp.]|nr:hypothetical protein [Nitrosarchaeum sp.]
MLATIQDQNVKIAKGIVALAERFKRLEERMSALETGADENPYEGLGQDEAGGSSEDPAWNNRETPLIHDPEPQRRIDPEDPLPLP